MAFSNTWIWNMVVAAIVLSGCSEDEHKTATKQDISALVTKKKTDGKEYFLRRAPGGCELLTLQRAQSIIGQEAGAMAGNSLYGRTGSDCDYLHPTGKHIGVTIHLRPHRVFDSRSMTIPELINVIEKMTAIPGTGFVETSGPGVVNLAFITDRQIYFYIFIGIGGTGSTDAGDRDIVSEVVLDYSLIDRTRSSEENINILNELAEEHYAAMIEQARANN